MRVAVCHPVTPFLKGGAEIQVWQLVAALAEAGHEAEVVSVPFKWYPGAELAHQVAMWRSLDLSESNGVPIDAVIALAFPSYLVRHPRKIVWLIHQYRGTSEFWDHPEYGGLAHDADGPAIRDLLWKADRVALGEAWRLAAISAAVAARLARSCSLKAEVIYHRSPLSDVLLERPSGPLGDYVLCPGRLDPQKRVHLAVEAMRFVKTPVRLVVIGSGPEEQVLATMAAEEGLSGRVRILPSVAQSELGRYYGDSLGVCVAPFEDAYPYVVNEALAAARPVVTTTDSGGPLESVFDGRTGLVTEPEPKAIAEAFDRLFAERNRAAAMGAAGRDFVRTRIPAWPAVVAALLDETDGRDRRSPPDSRSAS